MTRWNEGFEEFDERPDEYPNEQDPELIEFKEMEIPDVSWAKEIEKIEDPKLREKEIEIAEDIKQREKVLDDKLEAGEITKYEHWADYAFGIRKEKNKASTRCSLESVGLTHDHLGDLSEDFDLFLAEAAGDPKPAQMKDQLSKTVKYQGPEASQQLADDMLEEGKLTPELGHKTISRTVRLNKK
jgi:hypothetical protein